MAQRPENDYAIDPDVTSGTQLAIILNNQQESLDSTNSGPSRPPYLGAGGLWVKTPDYDLYMFDGTEDKKVGFDRETGDFEYVNSDGDTMTGTLIVPGIVINGGELNSYVLADQVNNDVGNNYPPITTSRLRESNSEPGKKTFFTSLHSNSEQVVLVRSSSNKGIYGKSVVYISRDGRNYSVAESDPLRFSYASLVINLETCLTHKAAMILCPYDGFYGGLTSGFYDNGKPRPIRHFELPTELDGVTTAVSIGATKDINASAHETVVAFAGSKMITFDVDANAEDFQTLANVLTQDLSHDVVGCSVIRSADGGISAVIEISSDGKAYKRSLDSIENEEELVLDYNGESDLAFRIASDGYSTVILPSDLQGYMYALPGQDFVYVPGQWGVTDGFDVADAQFSGNAGRYVYMLDSESANRTRDFAYIPELEAEPISKSIGVVDFFRQYQNGANDDWVGKGRLIAAFKKNILLSMNEKFTSYSSYYYDYDAIYYESFPLNQRRLAINGNDLIGYHGGDIAGDISVNAVSVGGVTVRSTLLSSTESDYAEYKVPQTQGALAKDPHKQFAMLDSEIVIGASLGDSGYTFIGHAEPDNEGAGCWIINTMDSPPSTGTPRIGWGDAPWPDIDSFLISSNYHYTTTGGSLRRNHYVFTEVGVLECKDRESFVRPKVHGSSAVTQSSKNLFFSVGVSRVKWDGDGWDFFFWEENSRTPKGVYDVANRHDPGVVPTTNFAKSGYSQTQQNLQCIFACKPSMGGNAGPEDVYYFASFNMTDLTTEFDWNWNWALFDNTGKLVQSFRQPGEAGDLNNNGGIHAIYHAYWHPGIEKVVLWHGYSVTTNATRMFTLIDPVNGTMEHVEVEGRSLGGKIAKYQNHYVEIGKWPDGSPKITFLAEGGVYLLPQRPDLFSGTQDFQLIAKLPAYVDTEDDFFINDHRVVLYSGGVYAVVTEGKLSSASGSDESQFYAFYTTNFIDWFGSYYFDGISASGMEAWLFNAKYSRNGVIAAPRKYNQGGVALMKYRAGKSDLMIGGEGIASKAYVDQRTPFNGQITKTGDGIGIQTKLSVGFDPAGSQTAFFERTNSDVKQQATIVSYYGNKGFGDPDNHALAVYPQGTFRDPQGILISAAEEQDYRFLWPALVFEGSPYQVVDGYYEPDVRQENWIGITDVEREGLVKLNLTGKLVRVTATNNDPFVCMSTADQKMSVGFEVHDPSGATLQVNGAVDSTTLRLTLDDDLSEDLVSKFGSDFTVSEHFTQIRQAALESYRDDVVLDENGEPVLDEDGNVKRERVVIADAEPESVVEKGFEGVDLKKLVVAMAKRILELEDKINGDAP